MIHRDYLEHVLTDHCNLRCSDCSMHSPFVDPGFSELGIFRKDLIVISEFLKVDVFRFIGGEPSLHPQLLDFVKVAKNSGISDRVAICTNGAGLQKWDDELFLNLDVIDVSVYIETKINYEKLIEFCMTKIEMAREQGHNLVVNFNTFDWGFHAMTANEKLDDATTLDIWNKCLFKRNCHSFKNGKYYKCGIALNKNQYLKNIGIEVDIDFLEEDGLPLHEPELLDRLKLFLDADKPLKTCSFCYGSSGTVTPRVQHTVKEITFMKMNKGRLVQQS